MKGYPNSLYLFIPLTFLIALNIFQARKFYSLKGETEKKVSQEKNLTDEKKALQSFFEISDVQKKISELKPLIPSRDLPNIERKVRGLNIKESKYKIALLYPNKFPELLNALTNFNDAYNESLQAYNIYSSRLKTIEDEESLIIKKLKALDSEKYINIRISCTRKFGYDPESKKGMYDCNTDYLSNEDAHCLSGNCDTGLPSPDIILLAHDNEMKKGWEYNINIFTVKYLGLQKVSASDSYGNTKERNLRHFTAIPETETPKFLNKKLTELSQEHFKVKQELYFDYVKKKLKALKNLDELEKII